MSRKVWKIIERLYTDYSIIAYQSAVLQEREWWMFSPLRGLTMLLIIYLRDNPLTLPDIDVPGAVLTDTVIFF